MLDPALRLTPKGSPGARTVGPHYHHPSDVALNTGTLTDKENQSVSDLRGKQIEFEIAIL